MSNMSDIDVDNELLIFLIENRPVLWDKTLDIFKDRDATRNAWHEVFVGIGSDFKNWKIMRETILTKETVQLMEDLERTAIKSNLPYKQVELFSLQVYVEDFKFSVFGSFPLDWTLLHTVNDS
ncbi:hypothetical protein FQR65_LT17324 [Abscondita terminalis]|nr:hypothetical protein FQR65_LT17324 [Abscondita terminalis]